MPMLWNVTNIMDYGMTKFFRGNKPEYVFRLNKVLIKFYHVNASHKLMGAL